MSTIETNGHNNHLTIVNAGVMVGEVLLNGIPLSEMTDKQKESIRIVAAAQSSGRLVARDAFGEEHARTFEGWQQETALQA